MTSENFRTLRQEVHSESFWDGGWEKPGHIKGSHIRLFNNNTGIQKKRSTAFTILRDSNLQPRILHPGT